MALNRRLAIYAGTFDPITQGHEDIARRASGLFDHVIVAIAASLSKRPFFTLDERAEMAREVLAPYKNIEVASFDGLLMDFLHEKGAKVILRGLRAASDFEYEFQLAGMNRNLKPDIETLFLTPSDQYMFISASMIREIAQLSGNVAPFVHPLVATRLGEKISKN